MPGDETNVIEDNFLTIGADFKWAFEVVPLDATGCSASLVIAGLATVAMSVDADILSVAPTSTFSVWIRAATTSGYAPGVYPYNVLVTFTDGSVLRYGSGSFSVQ